MSKEIEQYKAAVKTANELRNKARIIEKEALDIAEKADIPEKIRPATADDIVAGAVIWYKCEHQTYWKIVDHVFLSSDEWKAFGASDGCRYGLHDAYVEL